MSRLIAGLKSAAAGTLVVLVALVSPAMTTSARAGPVTSPTRPTGRAEPVTSPTQPAGPAEPVTSRTRPAGNPIPRMGAYASTGSELDALGQDMGAPVSYDDAFLDTNGWAAIDNSAVIGWYLWEYPGYQPVWNVPMLPMVSYEDTTPVGGVSLATEATGAYNSYFVTLAQELVAAGQGSTYLRLGWEMNGSWYPWSEDRCPGSWHLGEWSCYAQAWQQIVNAMRSVPGANFSFEWVPYINNASAVSSWPGKAYVNVVGLDVYDWNSGGKVASWAQQLADRTGLDWLRRTSRAVKLPETIAEWGLTKVTAMMNGIYDHKVVNADYWDANGVANPHLAWALHHDLQSHLLPAAAAT
jgi:hypothetical protein